MQETEVGACHFGGTPITTHWVEGISLLIQDPLPEGVTYRRFANNEIASSFVQRVVVRVRTRDLQKVSALPCTRPSCIPIELLRECEVSAQGIRLDCEGGRHQVTIVEIVTQLLDYMIVAAASIVEESYSDVVVRLVAMQSRCAHDACTQGADDKENSGDHEHDRHGRI